MSRRRQLWWALWLYIAIMLASAWKAPATYLNDPLGLVYFSLGMGSVMWGASGVVAAIAFAVYRFRADKMLRVYIVWTIAAAIIMVTA